MSSQKFETNPFLAGWRHYSFRVCIKGDITPSGKKLKTSINADCNERKSWTFNDKFTNNFGPSNVSTNIRKSL